MDIELYSMKNGTGNGATSSVVSSSTACEDDADSLEEEPFRQNNETSFTNCCLERDYKKLFKRRFPFVTWLFKYQLEDLKGDLIAGITVALTVIPQGLALSLLAGLPPQYGLYTAFMGCFMYAIFGSCKNLTIGPTAIMSLMTAEYTTAGGLTYVILITFLSGCIQLAMGILNLGFLVTFISSSVVSGFTSAAAITIAATQLFGIFGINAKSQGFLKDIYNFFLGLESGNIKYWDLAMGLSSITFLLALKYCIHVKFSCFSSQVARLLEILFRTISIARNALLVLLCTGIAAILISKNIYVLTLTQKVKPGLPPFAFPEFHYSYFNNATNQTISKNFLNIVQDMGSGLIVIPLLCILEAIAIAKSFDEGKKIDATQEMIALGFCNIMGSFVSSYPATGSFSRTAINYSSGVRTTAGGIMTGSLVLLALGFMSPYFQFIPKAALSALIFIAVLNMIHYKDVLIMWKTSKLDLLSFFATFIFSFILGLEYGILIGIGTSIILLLFQVAKPKIQVEENRTILGYCYLYIKPDRTILFPSSEHLQSKIIKSVLVQAPYKFNFVLIDGEHITMSDYTTSMSIKNTIDSLKNENVCVLFTRLRNEVQKSFMGASQEEFVHFISKQEAEDYINSKLKSLSSCVGDTSPLDVTNKIKENFGLSDEEYEPYDS